MLTDKFRAKGHVEIFVTKGKPKVRTPGTKIENHPIFHKIPVFNGKTEIDLSDVELIDSFEGPNIVVKTGTDRTVNAYQNGFMRVIGRMAIGDRGTIPSDSTTPKVPTKDMTALYNEVYRDDVDVVTVDTSGEDSKITFVKTFSAIDVPVTSLSNQANPRINEVALIMVDALSGAPLPRGPVAYPDPNDADEEMFAMRAFKSVPFDQANDLSITVRYTISLVVG